MSFAEEVASSRRAPSMPPPAAPEAAPTPAAQVENKSELPAAPATKVEFSVEDMDFNTTAPALPAGTAPVVPEAKVAVPEAPAEKTPVIRIGGMEFKSIEEAVKYADELAIAKQQEEAYLQGFQKAKADSEPPKAPEKTIDEIIEEKLFENPKTAIAEIRKVIKEEIFSDYNKMMADQQAKAQQEAASEKLWGDFYKSNAELSDPDTRDYIQNHLLNKHWDRLKDLPLDKSLPELADLARKALRIKREDALPSRELPSSPAIVPGASGNATSMATVATSQKELDFVSQVNTLRRRSAK